MSISFQFSVSISLILRMIKKLIFSGARFLTVAGIQGKYDAQSRTATTDALLPITFVSTIFHRKRKLSSIFCKMELPKRMENFLYFEDTIFVGNIGPNILIGVGKDVFQYNIKDGSWHSVQDYKNVKFERTEAKSCVLNDSILICGGLESPTGVELLRYERIGMKDNFNDLPHDCVMEENPHIGCLGHQKFCYGKIPVPCFFGHSITNIGKHNVLLIGGVDEIEDDNGWGNAWDDTDCLSGRSSNRVFKGSVDGENIIWKEVNPMKFNRNRHTAFKMNENVYVFGGNETRVCERFDLSVEKWSESYHLPLHLCCTPYFAIICGSKPTAVLLCNHFWRPALLHIYSTSKMYHDIAYVHTFTEENGFQDIKLPIIVKYGCDTYKLSQYIDMKTFRHFISLQL